MDFQKILFINSPKNDFLSDSFLIGLKKNYPGKVYEWPINPFIYQNSGSETGKMHGIGFTLYGLLQADSSLAYREEFPLQEFDLIIFGDIYRQSELFLKIQKHLHFKNTIILDGEDTPAIYPYYFAPWKKPYSLTFPKLHKHFIYYKREIIPRRTNYYRFLKFIPKFLCGSLPLPKNVVPISFSIPEEKIVQHLPVKTKTFGQHIVDEEVHRQVEGSKIKYAFDNEKDYYEDLQKSRFGITTKRGGWDCLRHYEIAANGAVICFRSLDEKPDTCAPHGLQDNVNCISYHNYEDLMLKISALTEKQYQSLQKHSLEWVRSKSCSHLVNDILNDFAKRVETKLH